MSSLLLRSSSGSRAGVGTGSSGLPLTADDGLCDIQRKHSLLTNSCRLLVDRAEAECFVPSAERRSQGRDVGIKLEELGCRAGQSLRRDDRRGEVRNNGGVDFGFRGD